MARLIFAAGMAAVAAAPPASAGWVDRWRAEIEEASVRFDLPENWIRQVILAESGGETSRDGRPIVSAAGAMGLMQLMPTTWAELRKAYRLGPDPHDPRDNILAGSAYLRVMYDRFGYPGLFAAYNAGPNRYADHLAGKRPLPGETRAYFARLARTTSGEGRPGAGEARRVRRSGPPADRKLAPTEAGAGLFFALGGVAPSNSTSWAAPRSK